MHRAGCGWGGGWDIGEIAPREIGMTQRGDHEVKVDREAEGAVRRRVGSGHREVGVLKRRRGGFFGGKFGYETTGSGAVLWAD